MMRPITYLCELLQMSDEELLRRQERAERRWRRIERLREPLLGIRAALVRRGIVGHVFLILISPISLMICLVVAYVVVTDLLGHPSPDWLYALWLVVLALTYLWGGGAFRTGHTAPQTDFELARSFREALARSERAHPDGPAASQTDMARSNDRAMLLRGLRRIASPADWRYFGATLIVVLILIQIALEPLGIFQQIELFKHPPATLIWGGVALAVVVLAPVPVWQFWLWRRLRVASQADGLK
jgi:hypothetical protein